MIFLPDRLLGVMLSEANDRFPRETGGILLGHWNSRREAAVTHIVGAGPNARFGRFTFEPDYDFQENEIEKIFSADMANCEYLGDWHTHPRGPRSPSGKDTGVLARISKHRPAKCKHPIMCILSGGPKWLVSAWQLRNGSHIEIPVVSGQDSFVSSSTPPLSSSQKE